MNYKEKYPKQRYLKLEKLVREKTGGKMYHIPERVVDPETLRDTIQGIFELDKETQEVFGVLCLNTKNKVISATALHRGSANASIVHPRDVYQYALTAANTVSIVVFHNHPSGDPAPSKEDINVTKRLTEAGKVLGVELLDHIILGDDEQFISLKEKGYL